MLRATDRRLFERHRLLRLLSDPAYGDQQEPILAQLVFISSQEDEDTRTVAKALLQSARTTAPHLPRFDWSTLRVNGTQTLTETETEQLIEASVKGQVGVGRVSKLKLSSK